MENWCGILYKGQKSEDQQTGKYIILVHKLMEKSTQAEEKKKYWMV